jgi:hypothetical protein
MPAHCKRFFLFSSLAEDWNYKRREIGVATWSRLRSITCVPNNVPHRRLLRNYRILVATSGTEYLSSRGRNRLAGCTGERYQLSRSLSSIDRSIFCSNLGWNLYRHHPRHFEVKPPDPVGNKRGRVVSGSGLARMYPSRQDSSDQVLTHLRLPADTAELPGTTSLSTVQYTL